MFFSQSDVKMELIEKKLKAPKSVWLIVSNELCERFNYYGLRTILVLYLKTVLNYSDDYSTMIYHGFVFLSYFMPMFGAILADSYWGKYKTIIRLSIVYVIGNFILTAASMAYNFTLDSQRVIAIVGLVLIAIGTGGIKPCVCSFGGDQFQLPEQQTELATFFNRFVTSVYIGALISTFISPELRNSTQCFGRDTCFPLAFGVLSLLMAIAIALFFFGNELYVKRKPENHVIFKTIGCVFYSLRQKCSPSSSKKAHWLDHSSDKYTEIEVSDTKAAMEVLYTYIAYPVFWALYEQQGSRWTLQAMLMNGKVESINWEIKPDQMQTIHPLCALLLILSFNSILFPFLAKFGIRRPLQKLIFSNSMAVVAFLIAAIVQYRIFGESTVIPSDECQLNIYNGFDCNVYVNSSLPDNSTIGPLDSANFKYMSIWEEDIMNITLKFDSSCRSYTIYDKLDASVIISKGKSISYFLTPTESKEASLHRVGRYDDLSKPKNGYPSLRIIISDDVKTDQSLALIETTQKKSVTPYKISSFANENIKHVAIGNYNLTRDKEVISSNIMLMPATIYTLVIRNNSNHLESKLYVTDKGNFLHMLWQIPQYMCMIIADVIFIATTIEFAFTEAPPRIKSFVSACYLLTQSVGNLVIVVISALSFHRQVHEYLFFSGLMLADTLLLAYLSSNYKYKDFKQEAINDSEQITKKNEIQLDEN